MHFLRRGVYLTEISVLFAYILFLSFYTVWNSADEDGHRLRPYQRDYGYIATMTDDALRSPLSLKEAALRVVDLPLSFCNSLAEVVGIFLFEYSNYKNITYWIKPGR